MQAPQIKRRAPRVVLAASLAVFGAAVLFAPRACSRPSAPLATAGGGAGLEKTRTSAVDSGATTAVATTTEAPAVHADGTAATPTPTQRLHALTVAFDEEGPRVRQALLLNGRVKAPPRSFAAERLEFQAYNREGKRVYEGAMDHPGYPHGGHVGANGQISRMLPWKADERVITLRMPEELAVSRIEFFETQGPDRRVLGSVNVQ